VRCRLSVLLIVKNRLRQACEFEFNIHKEMSNENEVRSIITLFRLLVFVAMCGVSFLLRVQAMPHSLWREAVRFFAGLQSHIAPFGTSLRSQSRCHVHEGQVGASPGSAVLLRFVPVRARIRFSDW
jgi:hypothetical protein